MKSFKTIDVLSKLAGLWIDSKKRIYYSQATHITFICPMVFDSFPLDTQRCKFQVKGSFKLFMFVESSLYIIYRSEATPMT